MGKLASAKAKVIEWAGQELVRYIFIGVALICTYLFSQIATVSKVSSMIADGQAATLTTAREEMNKRDAVLTELTKAIQDLKKSQDDTASEVRVVRAMQCLADKRTCKVR